MLDDESPEILEALQSQVQALIEDSELRDVRLTRLHADVLADTPDEVNAEFGISDISVQGGDVDGAPGFLRVQIDHAARFFSANDTVSTIEFAHTAVFHYEGADRPTAETIQAWVLGNVYFMVYPYVRETLQSACLRMDLPAVVLGYLQRGNVVPRNVSVVINSTKFDADIQRPEPAEASTDD